jgi:hypothetical protein
MESNGAQTSIIMLMRFYIFITTLTMMFCVELYLRTEPEPEPTHDNKHTIRGCIGSIEVNDTVYTVPPTVHINPLTSVVDRFCE